MQLKNGTLKVIIKGKKLATEPPTLVCFGLSIHTKTRDKNLIEKLYQLGLLQIENCFRHNVAKQVEI